MAFDSDNPKLTAYALGELDEAQRAEIEAWLESDPGARRVVEEIKSTVESLQDGLSRETVSSAGPEIAFSAMPAMTSLRWRHAIRRGATIALAASFVVAIGLLAIYLSVSVQYRGRQTAITPAPSIVPIAPTTAAGHQAQQSGADASRFFHQPLPSAAIPSPIENHPAAWSQNGGLVATGHSSQTTPVFHRGFALRLHSASESSSEPIVPRIQHGFLPGAVESEPFNTESYDRIIDNPFLDAGQNPLSTFSIDVDTASYSNIRRFLNQGQLPPKDAVRIEEMVNYFTYDYPAPQGEAPFSSSIEIAACPWNSQHRLVRIGLKGKQIATDERGPTNLVFLIDVSGSMRPANKLPLLKRAMAMLVNQLTENDRVAMVVYAGSSGLVLPSTSCEENGSILNALDQLEAGGSTNGGEGIELAYQIAAQNFIKGGINRVILCTDGDFNVGVTDQGSLTRLIEERATTGVFLSVLGFGMGNVKDSTMEKLADKGNGNYAYIDTLNEARKVLVEQMNGTLVTIAKDVKIQVEFNPAQVQAYRLIGYENRMLAKEDFNDDTKDAGEIGAGHTVTALYEVVPAGAESPAATTPPVDPLKYQKQTAPTVAAQSGEMLTLKLRYKQPDGDVSKLLEFPVKDEGRAFARASQDFKFAAAVAGFGMILRDSPHKGQITLDGVIELAQESKGPDASGYRGEFIELVRQAKALAK